jgi:hypothetical protein
MADRARSKVEERERYGVRDRIEFSPLQGLGGNWDDARKREGVATDLTGV